MDRNIGRTWMRRWLGTCGAKALLCVVLLVMGWGLPSTALANPNVPARYAPQDAPAAKAAQGKATLDVVVVRADRSGRVEPRLKELERQLSFTGFTGFRTVSEQSLKLGKGQADTVPGGAGYKLKTELLSQDGDKARVRMQILKGAEARVDTTVRLPKGKAFTVKGPKVKDGGAMIYVITYR